MKPLALALVLTCALMACAPRPKNQQPDEHPKAVSPNAPAARTGAPASTATPAVINASVSYNIGDVEQCVHLQLTLAEESKGTNVEVKELVRSNKIIDSSTLTISPPYPEHLWLRMYVILDNKGPEAPVVLRGALALGEKADKEIQSFKYVSFLRNPLADIKFDLMAHLDGSPESVLVGAKAEALLLPQGTDPGAVNAETATASPENMSTLLSNPLRVNFKRAPETK